MNLEGPGQKPGCMPCTDPRGCDYVALYDGADEQAPLIGTYSGHHLGWNAAGGGEDYLPSIVTSGSQLHIRFLTDTHNCGIDASEDPGWLAGKYTVTPHHNLISTRWKEVVRQLFADTSDRLLVFFRLGFHRERPGYLPPGRWRAA